MTNKTILFFFIAFMIQTVYSQELMSKKEIYLNWNKHDNERENPDNYKIGFDSIVSAFIDTLKVNKIDTIGAYEQDYVGAYVLDSCMCGIIPWEAYVHWIDNGVTYHKKFTECCQYESIRIKHSVLINYYVAAKTKIDTEKIMPVITGSSIDNKGDTLIEFSMVDHTTDFTFYCSLNGHSRFTRFQYYDLENEEGIFQKDNMNSAINSWRKMIDNQIKEIENK
jgi:hypothetical protein